MILRNSIAAIAILAVLLLSNLFYSPPALAVTQIALSDLSYKDCPAEIAQGSVTSGGFTQEASCFLVFGTAENKSPKPVYDADVYGRIYDADNNAVFQNRGRIGTIDFIPPGASKFEMRISIPSNLPTPLQLKQFKASGFARKIRQ
jgi:hypothetical protein